MCTRCSVDRRRPSTARPRTPSCRSGLRGTSCLVPPLQRVHRGQLRHDLVTVLARRRVRDDPDGALVHEPAGQLPDEPAKQPLGLPLDPVLEVVVLELDHDSTPPILKFLMTWTRRHSPDFRSMVIFTGMLSFPNTPAGVRGLVGSRRIMSRVFGCISMTRPCGTRCGSPTQ